MPKTRVSPTVRLVGLTVATALALVAPAQATTIEPNTTADLRANDGLCTLREAITASNERTPSGTATGECPAGEGGDTIKLAATRYELVGVAGDDANVSGDLDILESLTIVGRGATDTTIDAQGVDRVIQVGPNPTGTLAVTIDAVKITGGRAPDGVGRSPSTGPGDVTGVLGGVGAGGGGVLNRATLTLRNSAVTGNRAGTGGRGGEAHGADGKHPPYETNNQPAVGARATGGNGGPGGDGGGIRSDGKLLTVENSTIAGNRAGDGGGGGVGFGGDGSPGSGSLGGFDAGPGTGGRGGAGGNGGGIVATQRLKVVDTVVADNASGPGGAAGVGVGGLGGRADYSYGPGDGGNGTGGRGGSGGYGGGIAAEADWDIRRTLIARNTGATGGAGGHGYGNHGGNTGHLARGGTGGTGAGGNGGSGGDAAGLLTNNPDTIENATVTGNLAGDGGDAGGARGGDGGSGPGPRGGVGGDALAGNGGDGAGAGGSAQVRGGTLSHVTIYENRVGGGGASGETFPGGGAPAGRAFAGSQGNRGNLGALWSVPGTPTVLRNSIVASNFGGNCSGTVGDGGRNIAFGDASCPGAQADPKLGPLQDNGGPTATHSIPADSPALDAVPDAGSECAPTDQRGVARPYGSACDIGAFELSPPPPTPGDQPEGDGSGGGGSNPDAVAPLFTSASLTARVFAVNPRGQAESAVAARSKRVKRGTTFRYALSEPARVTFTIERAAAGRTAGGKCRKPSRRSRSARRCTRYVPAGRFAVASSSGANSHRFSGRIGRRALRPARYLATLVATDDAGNASTSRQLKFRVARR